MATDMEQNAIRVLEQEIESLKHDKKRLEDDVQFLNRMLTELTATVEALEAKMAQQDPENEKYVPDPKYRGLEFQ